MEAVVAAAGGGAAAGNVRASRQLGPAFFHHSPSARVDPECRRDGCFNDFIIRVCTRLKTRRDVFAYTAGSRYPPINNIITATCSKTIRSDRCYCIRHE